MIRVYMIPIETSQRLKFNLIMLLSPSLLHGCVINFNFSQRPYYLYGLNAAKHRPRTLYSGFDADLTQMGGKVG